MNLGNFKFIEKISNHRENYFLILTKTKLTVRTGLNIPEVEEKIKKFYYSLKEIPMRLTGELFHPYNSITFYSKTKHISVEIEDLEKPELKITQLK